eukprot:UN17165
MTNRIQVFNVIPTENQFLKQFSVFDISTNQSSLIFSGCKIADRDEYDSRFTVKSPQKIRRLLVLFKTLRRIIFKR